MALINKIADKVVAHEEKRQAKTGVPQMVNKAKGYYQMGKALLKDDEPNQSAHCEGRDNRFKGPNKPKLKSKKQHKFCECPTLNSALNKVKERQDLYYSDDHSANTSANPFRALAADLKQRSQVAKMSIKTGGNHQVNGGQQQ